MKTEYILLHILLLLYSCSYDIDQHHASPLETNEYHYDVEMIKSTEGRGKYLTIKFDSLERCAAAMIEERHDSPNLTSYCLEHYIDKKWVVFYHGEEHNLSKKIFYKPISTNQIRVHFLTAKRMPDIEKFTIYRQK